MNLNLDSIIAGTNADKLPPEAHLIKLTEEVGELASAHLCLNNVPNKSASSKPNVLEEGVDAVICALSYLIRSGFSVEEIQHWIEIKGAKRMKKILANQAS